MIYATSISRGLTLVLAARCQGTLAKTERGPTLRDSGSVCARLLTIVAVHEVMAMITATATTTSMTMVMSGVSGSARHFPRLVNSPAYAGRVQALSAEYVFTTFRSAFERQAQMNEQHREQRHQHRENHVYQTLFL